MNRLRLTALLLVLMLLPISAGAAIIIGPPQDVPIDRRIVRSTGKTLEFQPEKAKARVDTLVIGVSDLYGECNPFWANTFGDNYLASLLFDELVFVNSQGEMGAGVASVSTSADGKAFTFAINEKARYADGAPVSSADFINALYLILTPGYDGAYDITRAGIAGVDAYLSGEADTITGITQASDRVFTITVTSGGASSLAYFGIPALRVTAFGEVSRPQGLPPEDFDAFYRSVLETVRAANAAEAAYGQYRLAALTPGELATLTMNEAYWRGAPYIGTIELLVVPTGQEIAAILDGTVDIISALGSTDSVDAVTDFETSFVNLYSWEGDIVGYLGMDLDDPRFAEQAVRQALAMGFDRQAAKQGMIERYGVVPQTLLFDSFSPAVAHLFEDQFPFDQDRAMQLLSDAGWIIGEDGLRQKGGHTLSFTLSYNEPNPLIKALLAQMTMDFESLGIEIKAEGMPFEALTERIEAGECELYFQARRLPSSAALAADLFSGDSHLNTIGYHSEMLDRLLKMAEVESDPTRLNALYELYFQQLYMEMPFIPLYRRSEFLLANARVMNLTITTPHDITADAYRLFLVDTLEGQW